MKVLVLGQRLDSGTEKVRLQGHLAAAVRPPTPHPGRDGRGDAAHGSQHRGDAGKQQEGKEEGRAEPDEDVGGRNVEETRKVLEKKIKLNYHTLVDYFYVSCFNV